MLLCTLCSPGRCHPGGRAEFCQGRFGLDPRNFARVEQALDTAKIRSTPCPKPGFWLSADPGNFAWVENPSKMPGSGRFWPGREFSRPRQFCLGRAKFGQCQILPDPAAYAAYAAYTAYAAFVVFAEDKPVVSAEEKAVEFAEDKAVVYAEDKPVACQEIPIPLTTQPRCGCLVNAIGISWQATGLSSADTTALSSANSTGFSSADTTRLTSANNRPLLRQHNRGLSCVNTTQACPVST